jgi:O-methyltransferase
MKEFPRKLLRGFGFELVPAARGVEPAFDEIARRCAHYTMTPRERLNGLFKAIEYITTTPITGDVVECGVWKGGSCMTAALALEHFGSMNREIISL